MRISLSGVAGSGKDYIASRLIEDHGYTRFALADPMKRIVADVLGITIEEVNTRKEREPGVRRALQLLGTEVGRDCLGENVWVNKLLRDVRTFENKKEAEGEAWGVEPDPTNVVITDCRFRNEFGALKAAGFRMVYVTCPQEYRRLTGEAAAHPSETDLMDYVADKRFDVVVHNDRKTPVDEIVARILEGTK